MATHYGGAHVQVADWYVLLQSFHKHPGPVATAPSNRAVVQAGFFQLLITRTTQPRVQSFPTQPKTPKQCVLVRCTGPSRGGGGRPRHSMCLCYRSSTQKHVCSTNTHGAPVTAALAFYALHRPRFPCMDNPPPFLWLLTSRRPEDPAPSLSLLKQ